MTNSSFSIPTQTTVTCGSPVELSVVRWAKGAFAISSRIGSGIFIYFLCTNSGDNLVHHPRSVFSVSANELCLHFSMPAFARIIFPGPQVVKPGGTPGRAAEFHGPHGLGRREIRPGGVRALPPFVLFLPKTARAPLIQSWFTLLASTTIERDGEVMFSSS